MATITDRIDSITLILPERLGAAPRTARWAKPAPLGGKRRPLLVCAVNEVDCESSLG